MMRQPPDSVPRAMAPCGQQDHPERNGQLAGAVLLQVAAGEERAGDDAHGLLRIVGAVHQAEGGRRHQLHLAEEAVDPARRLAAEHPLAHHHQQEADEHADERREHDEDQRERPSAGR